MYFLKNPTIILLFTTTAISCSHGGQYKKHDLFTVKYTIREYYIPTDNTQKPTIQKTRKPLKRAKKPLKIDCTRVFKEVNQCMK